VFLSAALAGACREQARDAGGVHVVERARPSMGSELRLTAWTADEAGATAAFDAIFQEFDRSKTS